MADPVTPTIGIVLADDHPVVRRGLRLLLDAELTQAVLSAARGEEYVSLRVAARLAAMRRVPA